MLRRDFIKSGSVVAGGALLSPIATFADVEKIKLAILGTGWWGTDVLLSSALAQKQVANCLEKHRYTNYTFTSWECHRARIS